MDWLVLNISDLCDELPEQMLGRFKMINDYIYPSARLFIQSTTIASDKQK